MARTRIWWMVVFYLITYLTVYLVNPILYSYLNLLYNPLSLLLLQTLTLSYLLLVVFIILKLNHLANLRSFLGLKKHNLLDSSLWAMAVSLPLPLIWLIGTQLVGVDILLTAAKPLWAESYASLQTLILAILMWVLTALFVFSLLESFPYEFMKEYSKSYVILPIVILWAGIYNTPLLTGKLDPLDIVFFGLFFTLVYYKTRNSIGLLIAYLLNENPLWWVISSFFKPSRGFAFVLFLVLRLSICALALLFVVQRVYAKRAKS